MITARSIGASIRKARIDAGLTQKQLAQVVGLSERTLISIEMGTSPGVGLGKVLSLLAQLDLDLQLISAKQMEHINCEPDDLLYAKAFEAASANSRAARFFEIDSQEVRGR